MLSRSTLSILLAAALAALSAASAGAAEPHRLLPRDCVTSPGDAAGCGATATGLGDPRGVAVTPDGADVYVAATGDGAIVRFDRAPDGGLTAAGCIEDPEPPVVGCEDSAEGLAGAFALAVSPDNDSVYVVSTGDDAIVRFDRASDGELTDAGCVEDMEASSGCEADAQGLDSARTVTVSPDGASVYAAGNFDDAIVRFNRAASGALTGAGCIQDLEAASGCGASAQGLDAARGLVVSPDGANLYVASDVDDKLAAFDRSPAGALSDPTCIADVGATGCAGNAEGLNGAKAIAISPDGANVYVASITDNSIVSVDRAPDGTLSNPSCIKDLGGPQACADSAEGLEDARGVAASEDGTSVIVASGDDSALANFERAADGALSSVECIADVDSAAGCGDTAEGLENAQEVAISPDGTAVYAVSSTDSAVVRLARDAAPVCEPSSSTGESGEQQTVPLSCSDVDGDSVTIEVVSGPAHGALGTIDQDADTVTFDPDPGFAGEDSFEIRAVANGIPSAAATVSITVEEADPGPPGGPGEPGAPGGDQDAGAAPGSDATINCRAKRGRVIKCSIVFASAAGVRKARLSRAGVTYAAGKPVRGGSGTLVLRFRPARALRAGKYTFTVVQQLDGKKLVTRSPLRIGKNSTG